MEEETFPTIHKVDFSSKRFLLFFLFKKALVSHFSRFTCMHAHECTHTRFGPPVHTRTSTYKHTLTKRVAKASPKLFESPSTRN